ncbi:hypothetical protein [Thermococcus sp.]
MMVNAIIYGLIILLALLNIVLILLYLSAKNNPYYVVYDEETKSALKRRVLSLKDELESELTEFDVEDWERTLEESIEEEVKKL